MRRRGVIERYAYLSLILATAGWTTASGQVNLSTGSTFSYLKGNQAADLPSGWMADSFDDSEWSSGPAPFWYGDGEGGTLLFDMQGTYSTLYLRTTFEASQVELLDPIAVNVNYDDGFILWINGSQALKVNAPTTPSHDAFAPGNHESGTFEPFLLDPDDYTLVEGTNILAIQGFNISLTSSDFHMDIEMQAGTRQPMLQDSVGLSFSASSGFYEDPFYLEIEPARPGWQVVYTLDGSNPQDSESAILTDSTARILVDPLSTENRAQTPVFIVRASSYEEGLKPSFPESRSFIFLDRVLQQAHPGGEWPVSNVNNQVIDLGMDQRIVTHPTYSGQMIPALTDIPSISVQTGPANLFDPQTGIYVNAFGHGHAWERECSVELLDPSGEEGFQVNAGLRIRGGWSRHPEFAKHAFRLFFRSDYGDAKLNYPLFGEEGTDRFDKVDLRTAQNYAWSNGNNRNTFLRDVFSRDAQGAMEQPYTRSRYYHLYLDGMYWGLFQTQERSEARYASDYFGGKPDDYDVVKVDTEDWRYRIEATDGTLDTWRELWNLSLIGFSGDSYYNRIQGLGPDGRHDPDLPVQVELDNLIDYMLTIFYTGNFDAPTSSFGSNKGPNNFYAINSREDYSRGFVFFNHDAEHSLFHDVVSPGTGIGEDRVNLTERTDGKEMYVSQFEAFHPQWLHHKLTAHPEYRQRFADRAAMHLGPGGALSPEKNLERLNMRAGQIDLAIIGESARWGDGRNRPAPFTRDQHWVPQVNKIRNEFFPERTPIVMSQLDEAGLWPVLDRPEFTGNGEELTERLVESGGPYSLVITNPGNEGVIWYTLDGTDPRAAGGDPAAGAVSGGRGPVTLDFGSSAHVKARIRSGDAWSAPRELKLIHPEEDYSVLKITELHYHPEPMLIDGDTISGKDLEFIEFKNTGSQTLWLGGLLLDSAVYYEFPRDAFLAPGDFYVLSADPSAFYRRYGMIPSGRYRKNFANGGEEILLTNGSFHPPIYFHFSDEPPWPTGADGYGFSLVSQEIDPTMEPADPAYWRNSTNPHGSPFANDPYHTGTPDHSLADAGLLLYPNPTRGVLNIEWRSASSPVEAELSIFGIRGNLVHREIVTGDHRMDLKSLNLSPGAYLVTLNREGELLRRKVILQ